LEVWVPPLYNSEFLTLTSRLIISSSV
jgi:hypothetical protein